jgi:hypothetical protein
MDEKQTTEKKILSELQTTNKLLTTMVDLFQAFLRAQSLLSDDDVQTVLSRHLAKVQMRRSSQE